MLQRYSGIFGILILLISSVFYSIFPEMNKIYIPAFIVGGMIVLYAILVNWNFIISLLKGKAVKYSTNSIIYILIVLSILILLNFISFRNHKRIDVTESGTASLSPQTQQILEGLNEPVSICAFYRKNNTLLGKFEKLLRLYRYHSDNIKFEIIDPRENPGLIREKGIKQEELGKKIDGLSLIERGGRIIRVFNAKEQELTNAIVEASRQTNKVIYFIQGHGEKDIQAIGGRGLSLAVSVLKREYYDVRTLFITQSGRIPDDCTVLVVAGPTKNLFELELSAIKDFVTRGGRTLIMLDPGSDSGFSVILSEVGLKFNNDYIVDPRHNYLNDSLIPALFNYSDHKITRGWNRKYFTVFPVASSVEWFDAADSRLYNENLARTSQYSWAETDPEQRVFDAKNDKPGPLTEAVIAFKKLEADEVGEGRSKEGATKELRVALVGDSDFITDNYLNVQTNENFFLNLINWLAYEESLVSLRGKAVTSQSFMLSKKEIRIILYTTLSVPVLIIIAGIFIWLRRRTL